MTRGIPRDVVIIGGGVAGLSACIYARLAGHNVILLEALPAVGGKAAGIDTAGYKLDPGPSIVILKRLYERLFLDAGRRMEDYLQFRPLNPISRVCFEGMPTVDLPSSRVECERLVSDIDPHDGRSFKSLMLQLDRVAPLIDKTIFKRPFDAAYQLLNPSMIQVARYLDVRTGYRQSVDRTFQSPMLRAFFYGFPSYGGQSYDSVAPGAFLIPYLMIQEGVYYPEGGVAAIPVALKRLAIELGVDIRLNAKVVQLELSGNQVSSVRLSDGSTISGSHFICGADRLTCQKWLGREVSAAPSFSYFTVHWGLKKRWEWLRHHTLLIPKEFENGFEMLYRKKEFPDPPIIYLNETSGTDESVAPAGCSNLFAVVTSPAEEPHLDWVGTADILKESIKQRMAGFGIDFTDQDIDFERIQTPTYFRQAHGSYRGSLYGPDESQRLFGMMPLRNYDEKLGNLFYCGGSVQPGAGLPMVLLSGKFAAGKIR